MSIKISGRYLGKKRSELTHGPTGSKIIVDAPKDNNGEGSTFSPTDLVASALAACMMTVIAIVAERDGIDLSGMHVDVEKHMTAAPRRIESLPVNLHLPTTLTSDQRLKLENTAKTCPVHRSLHADVKIEINFFYDVSGR